MFGSVDAKHQISRSATGSNSEVCCCPTTNHLIGRADITNSSGVVLPLRVSAGRSIEDCARRIRGTQLRSSKNPSIKRQRTPARQHLAAVEVGHAVGGACGEGDGAAQSGVADRRISAKHQRPRARLVRDRCSQLSRGGGEQVARQVDRLVRQRLHRVRAHQRRAGVRNGQDASRARGDTAGLKPELARAVGVVLYHQVRISDGQRRQHADGFQRRAG